MIMYEEEFTQINEVISRLTSEANASSVFLIDKNGQMIASSGKTEHIDTTSLASLTAGNVAATGALAQILNQREFQQQYHEGERENILLSVVASRGILVVIFDETSSLGLVRLRVKKAADELVAVFDKISEKVEAGIGNSKQESPFAEITDEDIDSLFS
ncbi:MAG: dynein regulation protein LC7 [Candidatus Schekmanbacteria bacterium RBG_13_48_7]|uniref:Dynein regulation protein LC7 n=1 Tax=Candidatus Schekmanbacteria bacterium RBG_13_48_7 TaxID=1817878 RepID=A0A1F7RK73_9BACT|nr:MAG: dynein regulation protein LC7 [Candidatus Schekmanbacteria bacterium RBG_13_48_7]